jgi:hypothetical protein
MSNYIKNIVAGQKGHGIIGSAILGALLGGGRRGKSSPGMTAEDWENQNRLEDLRSERTKGEISHKSGEERTTISHRESQGRRTVTHKRKSRTIERGDILRDLDTRPHIGSYEQGADGQYKIGQREQKESKSTGSGVGGSRVSKQLEGVSPAKNTKTASSGVSTSQPAAKSKAEKPAIIAADNYTG